VNIQARRKTIAIEKAIDYTLKGKPACMQLIHSSVNEGLAFLEAIESLLQSSILKLSIRNVPCSKKCYIQHMVKDLAGSIIGVSSLLKGFSSGSGIGWFLPVEKGKLTPRAET